MGQAGAERLAFRAGGGRLNWLGLGFELGLDWFADSRTDGWGFEPLLPHAMRAPRLRCCIAEARLACWSTCAS